MIDHRWLDTYMWDRFPELQEEQPKLTFQPTDPPVIEEIPNLQAYPDDDAWLRALSERAIQQRYGAGTLPPTELPPE